MEDVLAECGDEGVLRLFLEGQLYLVLTYKKDYGVKGLLDNLNYVINSAGLSAKTKDLWARSTIDEDRVLTFAHSSDGTVSLVFVQLPLTRVGEFSDDDLIEMIEDLDDHLVSDEGSP